MDPKRHLLITGLPGTGKTTLLMGLVSHFAHLSPAGLSLLALLLLQLFPIPARAEFSIIIYVGKQLTSNSDLRLKKDDTDLIFRNVRWEEKSFTFPIFYGVRASYWPDRTRNWGTAVDFTHAKTILKEGDTVPVTGLRNGTAVDGREPISDTIKHFELSHGLNMITFNGLYRWFGDEKRDDSAPGRLQGYTGLGVGFSVPHVEARLSNEKTGKEESTGRYEVGAGPVVNGILGLNYDYAHFISQIFEYKISYSDAHGDLNGGGKIEAQTWNHQLITGLSGNVGR